MTRKELEAVCKVLKEARDLKWNWEPGSEHVVVDDTVLYIGEALCDALGLINEPRDKFLKAAGIEVIPPR